MFEALKTVTVRFWKEITSRFHIAGDSTRRLRRIPEVRGWRIELNGPRTDHAIIRYAPKPRTIVSRMRLVTKSMATMQINWMIKIWVGNFWDRWWVATVVSISYGITILWSSFQSSVFDNVAMRSTARSGSNSKHIVLIPINLQSCQRDQVRCEKIDESSLRPR